MQQRQIGNHILFYKRESHYHRFYVRSPKYVDPGRGACPRLGLAKGESRFYVYPELCHPALISDYAPIVGRQMNMYKELEPIDATEPERIFHSIKEPLQVILMHTPDHTETYDIDYYMEHEKQLLREAKIALFDWYWAKPSNCFRPVLIAENTDTSRHILKADKISFTNRDGECLKEDVVKVWEYYGYLENLETTEHRRLLFLAYDLWSIHVPIFASDNNGTRSIIYGRDCVCSCHQCDDWNDWNDWNDWDDWDGIYEDAELTARNVGLRRGVGHNSLRTKNCLL